MFFLHAERSARSVSAQICANKFANILSRDKMPSTVDSFDLKGVEWSGSRSATAEQCLSLRHLAKHLNLHKQAKDSLTSSCK